MHFKHCQIFRGTMSQLPVTLQGSGDQAIVIMWKKGDNKKRLCAATIESLDFSGFDPSSWSIVLFYNKDGTPGTKNTTAAPEAPPVHTGVGDDHQHAPPPVPIPPPPYISSSCFSITGGGISSGIFFVM